MFATIDIGTNSTLLLIGEPMPDGSVRAVEDRMSVTRLGDRISVASRISDNAAERTIAALTSYLELCSKHGVKEIAVAGTEALRRAANAKEFILLVKQRTGLDIDVIPAEREAKLTYDASTRDFGQDIIVIDIGGGSTELISPKKETSLQIGCVTLTERFLKNDPATKDELTAAGAEARFILERGLDYEAYARPHDLRLVATAGTATTLMSIHLKLEKYDPSLVHGRTLKADQIRRILDDMRTKSIDERKKISGLHHSRADVILAGTIILHEAMNILGYADVTISDRGLKWGLFYEKFCGSQEIASSLRSSQ